MVCCSHWGLSTSTCSAVRKKVLPLEEDGGVLMGDLSAETWPPSGWRPWGRWAPWGQSPQGAGSEPGGTRSSLSVSGGLWCLGPDSSSAFACVHSLGLRAAAPSLLSPASARDHATHILDAPPPCGSGSSAPSPLTPLRLLSPSPHFCVWRTSQPRSLRSLPSECHPGHTPKTGSRNLCRTEF